MNNYALIKDDKVVNVIIAESIQIAEEVSALECVEISEDNIPWIGFLRKNDNWVKPAPFPSWQLDENFDWQPPIPMPETGGLWIWNEELGDWEEVAPE